MSAAPKSEYRMKGAPNGILWVVQEKDPFGWLNISTDLYEPHAKLLLKALQWDVDHLFTPEELEAQLKKAEGARDAAQDRVTYLATALMDLRDTAFGNMEGEGLPEFAIYESFYAACAKILASQSANSTSDAAGAKDTALLDAFEKAARQDDVQGRQISEDEFEAELLGHYWQTPSVQSTSVRDAMQAAIDAAMAHQPEGGK